MSRVPFTVRVSCIVLERSAVCFGGWDRRSPSVMPRRADSRANSGRIPTESRVRRQSIAIIPISVEMTIATLLRKFARVSDRTP